MHTQMRAKIKIKYLRAVHVRKVCYAIDKVYNMLEPMYIADLRPGGTSYQYTVALSTLLPC